MADPERLAWNTKIEFFFKLFFQTCKSSPIWFQFSSFSCQIPDWAALPFPWSSPPISSIDWFSKATRLWKETRLKKVKIFKNNFKLTLDDLEAPSSQSQKAFPLFDVSRRSIQHSSADFCKARDRRDNESSRQRKLKRLLNRQKSRKFCEYQICRNKLELKNLLILKNKN